MLYLTQKLVKITKKCPTFVFTHDAMALITQIVI